MAYEVAHRARSSLITGVARPGTGETRVRGHIIGIR
jgi:hypothetical protein